MLLPRRRLLSPPGWALHSCLFSDPWPVWEPLKPSPSSQPVSASGPITSHICSNKSLLPGFSDPIKSLPCHEIFFWEQKYNYTAPVNNLKRRSTEQRTKSKSHNTPSQSLCSLTAVSHTVTLQFVYPHPFSSPQWPGHWAVTILGWGSGARTPQHKRKQCPRLLDHHAPEPLPLGLERKLGTTKEAA